MSSSSGNVSLSLLYIFLFQISNVREKQVLFPMENDRTTPLLHNEEGQAGEQDTRVDPAGFVRPTMLPTVGYRN